MSLAREVEETLGWALLGASASASALNGAVLCLAVSLAARSAEKAGHVFIASITAANLLLTLLHYPATILGKRFGLISSGDVCLGLYSVLWVGLPAAAFSLTLLNIDKILFFAFPLRYGRLMSGRKAAVAAAAAWLLCGGNLAAGLASGQIAFDRRPRGAAAAAAFHCNGIRMGRVWYTSYAVVFTVAPVLSSLLLSLFLLRLSRRYAGEARASTSPQEAQDDCACLGGLRPRSVVFIFATTAWTFAALVPARLYFLTNTRAEIFTELLLTHLLFLDPVVNPAITLLVNPDYRKAFRKGWRRLVCGRGKSLGALGSADASGRRSSRRRSSNLSGSSLFRSTLLSSLSQYSSRSSSKSSVSPPESPRESASPKASLVSAAPPTETHL